MFKLTGHLTKLMVATVAAAALGFGASATAAVADNGPTAAESAAVSWAQSQMGSYSYDGLCLTFVFKAYSEAGLNLRDWVDVPIGADTYPIDIWGHFTNGSTGNDSAPPFGALVFFADKNGDRTDSHVVISLGDGTVISTYDGISAVHQESMTSILRWANELGWWLPDSNGSPSPGPADTPPPDTTAPTITCAQPDGVWHAGNVGLDCTASDAGSGLADPSQAEFTLWTSVTTGSEDGNAGTNTVQVCDNAGNCATAGPITGNEIDMKAPDVALLAPTDAGTFGSPVLLRSLLISLKFSAVDEGSGISSWTLERHVAGSINSGCRTSWRVDRRITNATSGTDLVASDRLGLGRCYFWTLQAVDAVGNSSTIATSGVIRTPKIMRVS